ncbi:hypothetical protein BN946_scf184663.g3 [Trametes cinnabarina]|uniref:Uncharacterized protein n=1 Tax=Pycnoporus cinnabarinus TaxID=5643 RepID=A0A060SII4_PYCCI|nr:hypothetical protein BN946_scf184663.g3 [Trametes cinnabarina]
MHHRRKSRAHHRYLTVHDDFAGVAPRLNRLPQRLDYTLIPAPLDLSLPLVDEKADLPAIIVTPSSPVLESEFFIAFLAPPPTPTFSQRLASWVPSLPSVHSYLPSQIQLPATPFKSSFGERSSFFPARSHVRTVFLLLVLLFIMASHLVMHRLATNHPHLDFDVTPEHEIGIAALSHPSNIDTFGARVDVHDVDPDASELSTAGWFNLHALWAPLPATTARSPKAFVVVESPTPAEQVHDNDSAEDHSQAAA